MNLDKRQRNRLNRALAKLNKAMEEKFIAGERGGGDDYRQASKDADKERKSFIAFVERLSSQMYARGKTYGIAAGRTYEVQEQMEREESEMVSRGYIKTGNGWKYLGPVVGIREHVSLGGSELTERKDEPIYRQPCPTCKGIGWKRYFACVRCNGAGTVDETHDVSAFPS